MTSAASVTPLLMVRLPPVLTVVLLSDPGLEGQSATGADGSEIGHSA
jgi:hypothetical protein